MYKKEILVSVVIPCFNVENYIEECLNSVYNQTYKNIEVIAVDNNSSDNTLIKLNNYKNKNNESLIILSELKAGAPAARNKGLFSASGEWIQFLDADDLLKPEKIQHQIDIILKNEVEAVFAASVEWDINKNEKIKIVNDNLPENIFFNRAGNTVSNLWKKELLLKVKGWDINLTSSQETDLMFRMYLNGIVINVDDSVKTIIRQRESGQISQQNPIKRLSNYIQVRLDFISKLSVQDYKLYLSIKNKLLSFLVVTCIELYNYDSKKAEYYFHIINENWFPAKKAIGLSFWKALIIKIFGIRFYCELVQIISKK